MISQDPLCQLPRIEQAEDRTEEYRTAAGYVIRCKNLTGPVVVSSVSHDKLRLVFGRQLRKIPPVHPVCHTAPRTPHIQDDMGTRVAWCNIDGPAGLNKDCIPSAAPSGPD